MFRRVLLLSLFAAIVPLFAFACGGDDDDGTDDATNTTSTGSATQASATTPDPNREVTIRLGYFPNITHAQALVGIAEGTYQDALGENVNLEVKTFNAGPAVIEALFAGEIDISFIGPNPAINGYVKSDGEALRIIAGSASGGARFIVRPDADITEAQDLDGKTVASPQLGNTQDVALRAYIEAAGLETKEKGGTVTVLPTANPDILTLFQKGDIDGAWVPEPWATRLEQEAGGVEFVDERTLWPDGEFVTTHIIAETEFFEENPDVIERFLAAHLEVTNFVNDNPDEAKTIANAEIERLTTAALPQAVIDGAWSELTFTYDPIATSLVKSAEDAFALGFLGDDEPNLDNIYALDVLNGVLQGAGLDQVQAR